MSDIQLSDRLARADTAVAETVEDQAVIIDLNTSVYFSLNATGTFLWQRLDGHTTLSDISSALASHYEVPRDITDADVLELAQHLVSEGLARRS